MPVRTSIHSPAHLLGQGLSSLSYIIFLSWARLSGCGDGLDPRRHRIPFKSISRVGRGVPSLNTQRGCTAFTGAGRWGRRWAHTSYPGPLLSSPVLSQPQLPVHAGGPSLVTPRSPCWMPQGQLCSLPSLCLLWPLCGLLHLCSSEAKSRGGPPDLTSETDPWRPLGCAPEADGGAAAQHHVGGSARPQRTGLPPPPPPKLAKGIQDALPLAPPCSSPRPTFHPRSRGSLQVGLQGLCGEVRR